MSKAYEIIFVQEFIGEEFSQIPVDNIDIALCPKIIAGRIVGEDEPISRLEIAKLVWEIQVHFKAQLFGCQSFYIADGFFYDNYIFRQLLCAFPVGKNNKINTRVIFT